MDKFWYRYIYPKNLVLFDNIKLIAPEISKGGNFAYDEKGEFYSTTTIYGYIKKKETKESYKSLLAILNSQLLWWYLVNTGTVLANGYFRYKPNYLNPFPMPRYISNETQLELEILTDEMTVAINNNEVIAIENIKKRIDELIYSLYNLTSKDISTISEF